MSLDPSKVSIVHWFPDLESHKCGYCKSETGSLAYGMWAEALTPEDYQNLIDRGWRRSGKYCYKPVMKQTCCPQYTIRCDALNFTSSKSQKKIVKKFNKFLRDGGLAKSTNTSVADENEQLEHENEHVDIIIRDRPKTTFDFSELREHELTRDDDGDAAINEVTPSIIKSGTSRACEAKEREVKSGVGADPAKPPCKKAKLLRLEKRKQSRKQQTEKKTLQDLFGEIKPDDCHKLKVTLVPTSRPGSEWARTQDVEFELYKKYQINVHNDPPEKCSVKSFTRFLVDSPIKIKLVEMSERHEHFGLTARLYARYQMRVHNEVESDCSEETFFDFLIDSPIKSEKCSETRYSYGSFHQQYWLDDKLIAVGVIDILPKCISSVYFFYDPDYRSLTLGTYGSLREVEFVRTLHNSVPNVRYYYMGFYIHSCPKMRYKGKLSPSDLLCPETYEWIPIERCVPLFGDRKYSRLNASADAVDEDRCGAGEVEGINVLLGSRYCKYRYYQHRSRYAHVFLNIGELVGRKCARTLLVVSPDD